jgi:hypothetical protein
LGVPSKKYGGDANENSIAHRFRVYGFR